MGNEVTQLGVAYFLGEIFIIVFLAYCEMKRTFI